jgi:alpha-ketoglutarate-dependent taurine dioxygenase
MNIVDQIPFNHLSEKDHMISSVNVCLRGKGYCIVNNALLDADNFMRLLHESLAPALGGKDIVKDKGHDGHQEGTILSTTNQFFPLHTDCCFLDKPADLITLYCVENSASGGENILLNINQVIHLLSPSYVAYLLTRPFQFYSKKYPVLEKHRDVYTIRFNERELISGCRENDLSGLQTLLQLLNDPAHYTTVKLQPNQCLIVNNRSCLHGRYAFEPGSSRTFYRSRHYLQFYDDGL